MYKKKREETALLSLSFTSLALSTLLTSSRWLSYTSLTLPHKQPCRPTSPPSSKSLPLGDLGAFPIHSLTHRSFNSDGLKMDGTPDKRVNPEHGFGSDHERASELGKQGGKTGGSASADSESTDASGGDGADYK